MERCIECGRLVDEAPIEIDDDVTCPECGGELAPLHVPFRREPEASREALRERLLGIGG